MECFHLHVHICVTRMGNKKSIWSGLRVYSVALWKEEVNGLMNFRQGAMDKTGRCRTYAESIKLPGHHYIYVELAKPMFPVCFLICKIASAVFTTIVPGC